MMNFFRNLLKRIYVVYDINASYRVIYILGIHFTVRKSIPTPVDNSRLAHLNKKPIKPNRIVLRSSLGGYAGNSKYIAEEILRQKLPYELVWIVDQDILKYIDSFPPEIRLEMVGSDESLEASATARIWIDDIWRRYMLDRNIVKKEGQVYIQIWRGSFGIKKYGLGRPVCSLENIDQMAQDIHQITHFISHSAYETRLINRLAHRPNILELGHPKNDIFFYETQEVIRRHVFEKLGIPTEKKLLLYAPTRNNNRPRKFFNMDYRAVLTALQKKFGGEWIMAARMTPKGNRERFLPCSPAIVNISDYADIQELLVAADVCISDYSSCIFDFLLTGRPAFIYAADQKKFERTRGLYYPLSETPFPVAADNESMMRNIEQFDAERYQAAVQEFLKDKGCVEDGQASKRVVELIKEIMADNSNQTETI